MKKQMITGKQKEKLKQYFAKEPVDVVYLFGSQAGGRVGPMSDVDIGVLFGENISDDERYQRRIKYMGEVGGLVGYPDRADVVDVERVPVTLAYQVIRPKQEVLVKNNKRRVLFEAKTSSMFLDRLYFVKQNTRYGLAAIARGG